MNYFGFKDFYSVPCISDCGLSLGMGLYKFYNNINDLNFSFQNPYYGKKDTNLKVVTEEYKDYIKSVTPFEDDTFVQDVIDAPIIWFYGNAEIGPRALGHRSILGDPRNTMTKQLLNQVKQRQWWRPVAPIILENKVGEWFKEAYNSEYMLMTYNIKKSKANDVPSILHIDGTARVQTVSKANNVIYKLLSIFYNKMGVPILCNTSLNDKGEPIVDTIQQAINFTLRKKIKIAYINGTRIEFDNFSEYTIDCPEKRYNWYWHNVKKEEINPYNLNENEIEFYVYYSQLHAFDLTNKEDSIRVKEIVERLSV